MLKTLLTAALLVFSTSLSFASDIGTIGKATYKLFDEDRPICSATFVESSSARDLLLTAAHCVSVGDKNLNIRKSKLDKDLNVVYEEKFPLKVVKRLESEDTATLEVVDPTITDFITVDVATNEEAEANLALGAEVLTVSYPDVSEVTAVIGLYTGKIKNPLDGGKTIVNKATPSVFGGSSGGGFYVNVNDSWKIAGTVLGSHGSIDIFNVFTLTESVNKVLSMTKPETSKEILKNK